MSESLKKRRETFKDKTKLMNVPKADKTEQKDTRNPIAILVIYQIQRDIYFLFEYIYYLFTLH